MTVNKQHQVRRLVRPLWNCSAGTSATAYWQAFVHEGWTWENSRKMTQAVKNTPQHTFGAADRALLVYEIVGVGILFALTAWAMRPLLEEWGMFHAFNVHGARFFIVHFDNGPMRPLHILPYWLQWLSAGGQPVGVGIVGGLLVIARYLTVRWAVAPILSPAQRATFALLCAACVGWSGMWLGRFGAGQISSILFFAVVGFSIRLSRSMSIGYMLGSLACTLLILTIYQAPLLVMAALPFIAGMGLWGQAKHDTGWRRFLRVGIPLASGLIAYVVYGALIYKNFGAGYEGNLESEFTLEALYGNIVRAYGTVFLGQYFMLAFLYFILFSMTCVDRESKYRFVRIAPYLLAVLFLPIFSLIYPTAAHTNDPERMMFPVFLGFCLIVMLAMTARRTEARAISPVIIPVLAWALFCAVEVRSYWNLQSYVVRIVEEFSIRHQKQKLIIADYTGILGDIYTLYQGTLTAALYSRGVRAEATICTPEETDRLHPLARRFPVPSTLRCTDRELTDADMLVQMVDGRPRLKIRSQ